MLLCPLQLIDLSLDEYIEPLSALSEAATREHRIETGLLSMSVEWKKLELTLKPYKLTGTYSLTGPCADDIRALLEEHEIRTRTMQGSRPFNWGIYCSLSLCRVHQ